MPSRLSRFAHMTPALWWMFAAAMLLAAVVVALSVHGILNARSGGASPLLAPAAALMMAVLAPFTVLAQRRRKQLESQQ